MSGAASTRKLPRSHALQRAAVGQQDSYRSQRPGVKKAAAGPSKTWTDSYVNQAFAAGRSEGILRASRKEHVPAPR